MYITCLLLLKSHLVTFEHCLVLLALAVGINFVPELKRAESNDGVGLHTNVKGLAAGPRRESTEDEYPT
jgi:hypothetical protein